MVGHVQDLLNDLPDIVECKRESVVACDLLVTAGGFEARAGSVFQHVAAKEDAKAIVLRYLPERQENRFRDVVGMAESLGFEVPKRNRIDFDRLSVDPYGASLEDRLSEYEPREIVIDVSAMSKMAILLTLDVVCALDAKVSIFYSEAEEYGPPQQEFVRSRDKGLFLRPSLQVFSGVYGCIRSARLSSVSMQGQPTSAIVFMSFNEKITQCLLNSVSPSRLFLINGRPPRLLWREEATAWIHETLRCEWPAKDNPVAKKSVGNALLPRRSVSTLYYKESLGVLLELYWRLALNHRIVLSPSGSKMQAVGAFLFKALHRDVHIEYPTPKGFLSGYSGGVGQQWFIDFGNLREVVRALRARERRLMIVGDT